MLHMDAVGQRSNCGRTAVTTVGMRSLRSQRGRHPLPTPSSPFVAIKLGRISTTVPSAQCSAPVTRP